ncbi:MAG: NTF2 fold immunity protein [Muribaculaceae bacterium]
MLFQSLSLILHLLLDSTTVKEGGFPYIEINKRDGKVLRLTHYK